jgi:mono/diheme cytochrome c family protein
MRRSAFLVGAFLLVGFGTSFAQEKDTKEKSKDTQSASGEYKITAEDIARKSPAPTTPEGLAEARRFYGYQCAMCHGEQGDGKGELAGTMKLKLSDWRDAAAMAGKTDGELFYILTNGKGQMLGQGDRTKETLRWNLVSFIRSLAKKDGAAKAAVDTPKP